MKRIGDEHLNRARKMGVANRYVHIQTNAALHAMISNHPDFGVIKHQLRYSRIL